MTPEVRQLNGEDPTAFVISANIHRRHLTVGQKAMAYAQVYPEPAKRGPKPKSANGDPPILPNSGKLGFSRQYVDYARIVLEHAPEMVAGIMDASTKLDGAYRDAKARKDRAELEDPTKAGEEATLAQKGERRGRGQPEKPEARALPSLKELGFQGKTGRNRAAEYQELAELTETVVYRRGGSNLTEIIGSDGPSLQYIGFARTVLRYSPELVPAICPCAIAVAT